jgi:UDP-N-acetylmuramoyl-tripeptide--D-alanyl-D-alanine ligase
MNALAASSVAITFGMSPEEIAKGLRTAKPPHMRGEVLDFAAGFTVVDDSYNSNPRSLMNMVGTIVEAGKNRKRKIVIAGEMLELGDDEASLHRDVGGQIAAAGVDILWGVRGLAQEIVEGALEKGLKAARFFPSAEAAAAAIAKWSH